MLNMLREIKVQIARRYQGGHLHSAPVCVNQLEDLLDLSKRGQANQE